MSNYISLISKGFFIILFGLILIEFLKWNTIIKVLKESMRQNAIIIMEENWDDNYESLRESYAGGYKYSETTGEFEQTIDFGTLQDRITDEFNLHYDGTYFNLMNNDTGHYEWRINNINATITNSGFKNIDNSMEVELTMNLEIPIRLGDSNLTNLKLTIGEKAIWTPKM